MTSGNEFENIIQRMAQNKQSNVAPQPAAIKLLSVLAAFSTISFFGGFIIMVANTIVNDAYSNLDALRPGISFLSASKLFCVFLLITTVFSALKNAQNNS
jgi:hypothetical protein